LAESIFDGVRTPILAMALTQEGPPTIVDCNQAASKLIGYKRSEIVDRSVKILDAEVDARQDLWKPLRAAGKNSFDIVGRELRRKDGTVFPAELKVSPLLNSNGRQIGSITVLSDLTRESRMEAKRLKYEDRLQTLHRHSVQLSSASTMDSIVNFTLEAIQQTLNVTYADFNSVELKTVRLVKSLGMPPQNTALKLPRDGPGVIVRVANTKKTQMIPDTREEPSFVDERVLNPAQKPVRLLSELATPVLLDGEVVAVLNVESESLNAFSVEDQRFLEFIAFHASAALKRLMYEKKLTALHVHSHILGLTQSLDEIVDCTLEVMLSTLGFEHSDIRLVEDGWLRCKGARGMKMINADLRLDGPGVTVKAANTKKTVRVMDARKEPSYVDRVHDKGRRSPTMLSELAVPVVVHEQTVAVLNVESTKVNAIKESDQTLLEILGTQVASAVKRLEDSKVLLESEEKYRTLVENINDTVFSVDATGQITYISPVIERITGYRVDEVVGQPFSRYIHADDLPALMTRFAGVLAGNLVPFEFRVLDRNGAVRHVRASSRPLKRAGKVVGVTGVMIDITEHRKEKLAPANS
jgi:PAS domain S-box-containing protein